MWKANGKIIIRRSAKDGDAEDFQEESARVFPLNR